MLDGVGNRTGEEFDRAISDEHLKMISEDWRDLYIGDYIGAPSATIYRKGAPEYEEKLDVDCGCGILYASASEESEVCGE